MILLAILSILIGVVILGITIWAFINHWVNEIVVVGFMIGLFLILGLPEIINNMEKNYYGEYKLENGEIVTCKIVELRDGGTYLSRCDNNKTYLNQINLEVIKDCTMGCES